MENRKDKVAEQLRCVVNQGGKLAAPIPKRQGDSKRG